MQSKLQEAKVRLDSLIAKGRVDLYKPIQIAEVLYYQRVASEAKKLDLMDVEGFRKLSRGWRDLVTVRLLGKCSNSSARYQDDVWNESAMPPRMLVELDRHNQKKRGEIEAYIYRRFADRQGLVTELIENLKTSNPSHFKLEDFLAKFDSQPGLKRSVDKAYEIVTFAILDLLIRHMSVRVFVEVPSEGHGLLDEFRDLGTTLMGLSNTAFSNSSRARIYRVGVTNAADRGLDMWANFGPAIQVKHLKLSVDVASTILRQLEAESVVVVCRDADSSIVRQVMTQLPVSKRIAGIVQQTDLIRWYEQALRGRYRYELGPELLASLVRCFEAEFPQATSVTAQFMQERAYDRIPFGNGWAD